MESLPMDQLRRAEEAAKTMLIGTWLRSGLRLAMVVFMAIMAVVLVLLQ